MGLRCQTIHLIAFIIIHFIITTIIIIIILEHHNFKFAIFPNSATKET